MSKKVLDIVLVIIFIALFFGLVSFFFSFVAWATKLEWWIILITVIGFYILYGVIKLLFHSDAAIKSVSRLILFIVVSIPILILLWGVHPILGLVGLGFFFWLANNKWKTGYYFGD